MVSRRWHDNDDQSPDAARGSSWGGMAGPLAGRSNRSPRAVPTWASYSDHRAYQVPSGLSEIDQECQAGEGLGSTISDGAQRPQVRNGL
jgi:hypothetical protein